MKTRTLSLLCLTGILCLLFGCAVGPDEKAQTLYAEASRQLQNAKTETASYGAALAAYLNAKNSVDRLLAEYPSSPIAASLRSGQARIAGYTLAEFNGLEATLKPLAKAEQNPLAASALLYFEAIKKNPPEGYSYVQQFLGIASKYVEAELFTQAFEAAKAIQDPSLKNDALVSIAVQYHKIDQALTVIQTVEDKKSKAKKLVDIAGIYAESGQTEESAKLLSQTLGIIQTIADGNAKDSCLTQIAVTYAKAGLFPLALETVKTIKDQNWRRDALVLIAGRYIKNNQFAQALELAQTVEDGDSKARIFNGIAEKYAEAGQFTQALETAQTIEDGYFKALTLSNIVEKLRERGQLGQALQIAQAIEDGSEKIVALSEIASKVAESGNFSQALKITQLIKNVRPDNTENNGEEYKKHWQGYALATIAEQYAEAGKFTQALEIVQTIKDRGWKASALGGIAERHAKAGQFNQALKTVKTINYDYGECGSSFIVPTLIAILKFIDAEQKKNAERTLSKTTAIAHTIDTFHKGEGKDWEGEALAPISAKYAELGQFTQALEIAKTIKAEYKKASALDAIAGEYAKVGQFDQALEIAGTKSLMGLLLDRARRYAEDGQKETAAVLVTAAVEYAKEMLPAGMCMPRRYISGVIDYLGVHARQYAKVGQKEMANRVLALALELVNLSEAGRTWKYKLLPDIAGMYAEIGQYTPAIAMAQTIPDEYAKAESLAAIADQAAKTGYQFNENDKAILRAIVNSAVPMKTLWLTTAAAK